MKKILLLVLSLFLVCVVLVGCSETPSVNEPVSTTEAEKAEFTVTIDGNTFTDGFTEDDFYAPLNNIDGLFCTKNEETNKYTLKMTSSAYSELKEIKAKDVYTEFDRLKNDTENYIDDITYDEDFRNVKIIADFDKWPLEISVFDDEVIGVASAAMAYQIYTVEGQSVKVTIMSPDTGVTVIEEFAFPIVI